MKKINLILIFLLFSVSLFSQITIKGLVTDKNNQPIPYVNVLIKTDSGIVIAYTHSKDNGKYLLKTIEKGKFSLTFSSLGYETLSFIVELSTEKKEIIKEVILKEKSFELDEVLIKAKKSITIKKDTITIKVSSYSTGNESVIEDLLKKIPGITVNNDGTIKVGNREIEKLMIDDDDFFDKGYKILSKNMPVNPVDKIELLQNYSNNKLLKGVEHSDKIALNLVLKEDAKRQWFGNFTVGYDLATENRYSLKSYLMNFGKKNKYVFLTNLNNIGYDATGDINHLIRPFRQGEPASIGDNQSVNKVLYLSSFTPSFKASRTNLNNTELASLNAIFTLSKKIKLKTIGFFNWDEQDFFKNATQFFFSNGTDFINTEDYVLRKKKFTGFGKMDLLYDISKTKMLEITSKYNNQEGNDRSNLVFNGASTIENLQSNNSLFDQKVTYTNKFKDNKVFLLTGRYINESEPQNYTINQFFYEDLFPTLSNANNVTQQSENKMQFSGFEAHLLDRKRNGNLLELQFGNQYRKDELQTSLVLREDTTVLDEPVNYQNNIIYSVNDLYFNTKYRYEINDFAITGKIDFHQLFNQIKEDNSNRKQQPFFINPRISLDWEINNRNKVFLSYAYNTTNAKILDIYNNYILTDYRSFSKGTGAFNQLDASKYILTYRLGNWNEKFFANTSVIYTKNFDFFSTNTFINQNYSQSSNIIIKDREILTVFSNINRYFKFISSNIKIEVSYTKSNYKNIINDSELREINSTNYNYGFELRSGFQGFFNYHFGSKSTVNKIQSTIDNSFTNNVSFLDLSFDFNKKFNVQIQTERYYFGNIGQENNAYYFADLEARYKLDKLTFSLSGKNLFNTEEFINASINDISTSTIQYRLIPRYVLLKMEYRF